jgi:hypothetical protein
MSDKQSLVDRTKRYFGTLFPPKAETVPELPDAEADENLYEDYGDEPLSRATKKEQNPSGRKNEVSEQEGFENDEGGSLDSGDDGSDSGGGGLLIGAEEEDGIDWKNHGADTGDTDPDDDGSAAYAKRISDAQEALFGATGQTNQAANARSGTEKDEFYNPTQSPEQSAPAQDPNVPPADAPQVGTPAADAMFKEAFGKMTTPSAGDPFTVGPKPPSHDVDDNRDDPYEDELYGKAKEGEEEELLYGNRDAQKNPTRFIETSTHDFWETSSTYSWESFGVHETSTTSLLHGTYTAYDLFTGTLWIVPFNTYTYTWVDSGLYGTGYFSIAVFETFTLSTYGFWTTSFYYFDTYTNERWDTEDEEGVWMESQVVWETSTEYLWDTEV